MTQKILKVACPYCKKEIIWHSDNQFRPFCSERCRLIDLGEWAAEEKKIPGETNSDMFDDDSLLH